MKKVIFCIAVLLISSIAMGQTAQTTKVSEQKVIKVDTKTFKATKQSGTKGSGYQPTGYSYIDTDGNKYEIYSHVVTRGNNAGKTQYYIKRVSKKTGKPYWKRIDVSL